MKIIYKKLLIRTGGLWLLSWFCIVHAFAQGHTVSGTVTEMESGATLPGVNIVVKGTTIGTVTDVEGNYRLSVPDENSILIFSFIGYTSEEINVNGRSIINVSLTADIATLSEVVVIGYGERERKDVVGSISDMKSDEISRASAISPDMAMQGRMPGVLISTPSGNPLERPTVQIRGRNTFGFADPLYVIDGVPVFEGGAGDPSAGIGDIRSPINVLSLINPNDIESISVLKDAAASAIYGVRAANGVILITTKKGAAGKPKVDVSAFRGIQNITNNIDLLNTSQYVALYQESHANNDQVDLHPTFDPSSPEYLGNRGTHDWQTPLLNRDAVIEDYSVRVSGGSEATQYFTSVGYSRTEGVLKENSLKRYSLALNINSEISKFLNIGVTYRLANSNANNNTRGDLGGMYTAPPWQPVYDASHPTGFAPSTALTFKPNENYDPDKADPGPPFEIDNTTLLWGEATRSNPLGFQAMSDNTYSLLRNMGNAFVELVPFKGLRIRGSLMGDWYYNSRESWSEHGQYIFNQTPGNPFARHDGTAVGSFGQRDSRNWNFNKELSISYGRAFGDHNFDILLNASDQYTRWEFNDISTSQVNSADPNFRVVREGVHPAYKGGFTGFQEFAMQGYMGRLSYKFKDKYYVDATLRRDGSSRFAPEQRWGLFPGVAVAWRVTSEDFMQNIPVISDMKIRATWGQLGNQETTRGFAYLSTIHQGAKYALGLDPGGVGTRLFGSYLPNFPNSELSWETVETFNIGFDAGFLQNRITLTAEYYDKNTKDIIQSVKLPPNTGIQDPVDLNVAEVRNNGVEFLLGYNENIGEFRFSASANLTTVKNRVVSLNNGLAFDGAGGRVEEGHPIGYIRGYKVGGIFQNQQEIDTWKEQYEDKVGEGNPEPGDMYFLDVEGIPEPGQQRNFVPDGVINPNDRVMIGKTIPGYYYGLNLGVAFKSIDFSMLLQGVGDVQKYNWMRAGGEGMSSTGANQWSTTLDRWTESNPSTTMPRAVRDDPNSNNRFSDRFVEDAGFLRLRNVQIGFSLPSNVLSKIGVIERFRIYASGVNLLTFTNWTGMDPENDVVPPTRQVMLGLNATF